jgi:hypothetical protein
MSGAQSVNGNGPALIVTSKVCVEAFQDWCLGKGHHDVLRWIENVSLEAKVPLTR